MVMSDIISILKLQLPLADDDSREVAQYNFKDYEENKIGLPKLPRD